jgi:hypothetical protein
MTITFENDNDVIVYALERIIAYARRSQQVFVAHCVWWLASIIGLQQGLINHIDNIQQHHVIPREENCKSIIEGEGSPEPSEHYSGKVHPDRVQQISSKRVVSPTPRDITENQRLDQILGKAEVCIEESEPARIGRELNRVNPLPRTKRQLKKARQVKRLEEARNKEEAERNIRLQEIRDTVISYLSQE